jgi:hypothetical protein
MPSTSARWAASLSRGLHITRPSSFTACNRRLAVRRSRSGAPAPRWRRPGGSGWP